MIKRASNKIQKLFAKRDFKIFEASDSNTIIKPSKGVKLRFEYDHIAPSGFGIADQEGTDSYSLVRIRPMFEQEAPR